MEFKNEFILVQKIWNPSIQAVSKTFMKSVLEKNFPRF